MNFYKTPFKQINCSKKAVNCDGKNLNSIKTETKLTKNKAN